MDEWEVVDVFDDVFVYGPFYASADAERFAAEADLEHRCLLRFVVRERRIQATRSRALWPA